jgi:hypothetical protein
MKKLAIGIFSFLTVSFISCSDDENNSTLPGVTTTIISSITINSAISGGVITSNGGENITAKGVIWSTSQNPTIELSTKTVDGTGTDSFTSSITSLSSNTTYYVRAYATNNVGTSYGNEVTFTTSIDVTTGLVAYYPFSGNANDASGNTNHGTVLGNVTLATDRFGNSNKAYSFPGNPNSYIDCGNNPTIQVRGALTLSAWIYIDGGSLNPRILQYSGSGNNGGYTAFVSGTSNSIRLHATNYNDDRSGTGFCCGSAQGFSVPALSWQHFVYTTSATGLAKMYINGILVGEHQGVPVNNINYANTLNIGKLPIGSEGNWGGKLDEIRIYNRLLNTAEINYLFQN